MKNIYKCKSKVVKGIVNDGTSGATTVTEVLAPSGQRACLRSFSGFSTTTFFQNVAISSASKTTLVSVNFKESSGSVLFKIFLPVFPPSNYAELGGNGGLGCNFHIPGPGLLFDNGLTVEMVVPANPESGGTTGGQVGGLLNVVYSV